MSRFVRGRRLDRNPLRRASDRVETAVLAALVIAFLVGAPLAALAVGAWAHDAAHRVQLAERASSTQVSAVTVTAAPSGSDDPNGLDVQVLARWTAPDGAVVTGEVTVPPGTAAGAAVQVWSTRDGHLTMPPLQDSQVSGDTVLAEACAVVVLGGTLTASWMLARRMLDRHRLAAWDAEWRSTGPRWTTRA